MAWWYLIFLTVYRKRKNPPSGRGSTGTTNRKPNLNRKPKNLEVDSGVDVPMWVYVQWYIFDFVVDQGRHHDRFLADSGHKSKDEMAALDTFPADVWVYVQWSSLSLLLIPAIIKAGARKLAAFLITSCECMFSNHLWLYHRSWLSRKRNWRLGSSWWSQQTRCQWSR